MIDWYNDVELFLPLANVSVSEDGLRDLSLNGNDGVANGGVGFNTAEDAFDFDGSDDEISIPDDSSLDFTGSFTVSIWAKGDGANTGGSACQLISKNDGTNNWQMDISQESSKYRRFRLYIGGTGYNAIDTNTFSKDTWYLYTGVYDSSAGTIKLYINDVLSVTTTSVPTSITANSEPIIIGKRGGSTTYSFKGEISSPMIFNKALSSSEISELYNLGRNYNPYRRNDYYPLFKGLVAGYDFKGDAKDFSGNGNDLTLPSSATLTTDQNGITNSAYSISNGKMSSGITPSGDTTATIDIYPTNLKFMILNQDEYTTGDSIAIKSNGTTLRIGNNSGTWTAIGNVEDYITINAWNQLTVVYNGSNVKLYINGEYINYCNNITSLINKELYVLGREHDTSYEFNGILGLFLLFSRALSADEVKTLYNLTKKGLPHPYKKLNYGGTTE